MTPLHSIQTDSLPVQPPNHWVPENLSSADKVARVCTRPHFSIWRYAHIPSGHTGGIYLIFNPHNLILDLIHEFLIGIFHTRNVADAWYGNL